MQSRLMLIISHSVVKEADGGTRRTHLIGLALNDAGGIGTSDWRQRNLGLGFKCDNKDERSHWKILKT